MLHDLIHFLYITNREITLITLCAMFPLDVILFMAMASYSRFTRLVFGYVLVSGFAWALSWFVEPGRPPTLEPIMREFFLIGLLVQKGKRIVQIFTTIKRGKLAGPEIKPFTKRSRTISLLAGGAASVVSIGIATSFWLFTVYRNNEDKEAAKLEAVNNNTQVLVEVQNLIHAFKVSQDSLLHVAKLNGGKMSAIEEQGAKTYELAQSAAVNAGEAAKRQRQRDARERADRRGKTIPVSKIVPKAVDKNWYDPLLKRFKSASADTVRYYRDSTLYSRK